MISLPSYDDDLKRKYYEEQILKLEEDYFMNEQQQDDDERRDENDNNKKRLSSLLDDDMMYLFITETGDGDEEEESSSSSSLDDHTSHSQQTKQPHVHWNEGGMVPSSDSDSEVHSIVKTEIYDHLSRNDLSSDEKLAFWFTPDEIDSFGKKWRKLPRFNSSNNRRRR